MDERELKDKGGNIDHQTENRRSGDERRFGIDRRLGVDRRFGIDRRLSSDRRSYGSTPDSMEINRTPVINHPEIDVEYWRRLFEEALASEKNPDAELWIDTDTTEPEKHKSDAYEPVRSTPEANELEEYLPEKPESIESTFEKSEPKESGFDLSIGYYSERTYNRAAYIDSDDDAMELDSDDIEDKKKSRMELYDWVQCVVVALICGVFIFVLIGRKITVDGNSMYSTLKNEDQVIMHDVFYTPSNGDIIVFYSPTERFGGVPLVKRVIAVAGQTVDIDFDKASVYVNGVELYEPYINNLTTNREHFTGPVTVPDGYVFVMGDNRNSSTDSRHNDVGLVDTRYILGQVLFLLIPGDNSEVGEPRDWGRIGAVR